MTPQEAYRFLLDEGLGIEGADAVMSALSFPKVRSVEVCWAPSWRITLDSPGDYTIEKVP